MSVTNSNGYILIYVGREHPLANPNGYAYEHRIIMENKLGRSLKKGEIVHHKDGNKSNNQPDNLELKESIQQHLYEHRNINSNKRKPGEENPIIECACGCGTKFPKFDNCNRPRKFISGHNTHPYAETQEEIIELLTSGITYVNALVEITGKSKSSIKTCLSKLFKANKIKRISRGVYTV